MILIGTVHTDLEGSGRLRYLLNLYKPRIITIEIPSQLKHQEEEARIAQIKEKKKLLLEESILYNNISENLQQYLLKHMENQKYEFSEAHGYSKRTGAELCFVDYLPFFEEIKKIDSNLNADLSEETLQNLRRIFESMEKLSFEDLFTLCQSQNDQAYYGSKNDIRSLEEFVPKHLIEEREQYMADKILQIMPEMHIGGVGHMYDGFEYILPVIPLYKRLGNAVTKKIRLNEAFWEE